MEHYNEMMDISEFLPASVKAPLSLENLYKETPMNSQKYEDFLKLPLNPQYIINKEKELKEKEEISQ